MQVETRKFSNKYWFRATSFNPKNFTEETPKKVVSEYLKSIEADLLKTFQKYQDKGGMSIKEIIKSENVNGKSS
jgi:NADPH-dependent 7-cyano-7-deazaguanine reductase QueF